MITQKRSPTTGSTSRPKSDQIIYLSPSGKYYIKVLTRSMDSQILYRVHRNNDFWRSEISAVYVSVFYDRIIEYITQKENKK